MTRLGVVAVPCRGDAVLVGFNVALGAYAFPGGKLEPGESVPACLARELREELRVEIDPSDPFRVRHFGYTEDPGKWVCLLFLVDLNGLDPAVGEPDKFHSFQWHDPAKLGKVENPYPSFVQTAVRYQQRIEEFAHERAEVFRASERMKDR
jgi:8-oxo-dGTP pyrophosphatase MutT (NUDIX family)